MSDRWRAAPLADLLWGDCGDSFAVYHRPSGKTHFVNLATAFLLRDALVEPATAEYAAAALAKAAGADRAGSPPPVVELLQHLETQGLVERLDP